MTENEDNPEWVKEDFAQARPFKEGVPRAVSGLENCSVRPIIERPKVHVGFRLAADVVEGIKATGKGYNARVEQVLREAFAQRKL